MVFERYITNYMDRFDQLDRGFWNYEDGCILIGAQAMYEATGDRCYFENIRKFIDRYVGEDGAIRFYDPKEYNIDRIPSGRVLYMLYDETGEVKYKKAIERLMGQLREHPRTESGSFWHKLIYPYQIWLDGLYMGMPFYLLYEKTFHDGENYSDIIDQFLNARRFLYDEKKHLYYHAYDEKKEQFWADKESGLSPNVWSRAMGWYLMALADCYEIMPKEQKTYRTILVDLWTEALDGMLEYQDQESGLFYQLTELPDEEGNYLETSSSSMVAYSIFKGCRLGVLKEAVYRARGEIILIALETRMFQLHHGQLKLTGMCVGAGLGPEDNLRRDGSVAYYLAERIVADEQKGVGTMMMAYSEWLKIQKTGGKVLGGIDVDIYNSGY